MTNYIKVCKWCDTNFTTIKQDKEFCSANHKKQWTNKQNKKPKNKFICENCEKPFESYKLNLKSCSRKCIQDIKNKEQREVKRVENNIKYKDILDIPTCEICGWKSRSLQNHLVIHNLTVQQYREQYNVLDVEIFHSSYTQEKRDRISGNKNPGYQHGGTRSSFSTKCSKYDGLTNNETHERIQEQITKANLSKAENSSYNTTIQFYIKKGYTLDEAKTLLSERQRTFSLDICIKKLGEEQGTLRWLQRQDRWLTSMENCITVGYSIISQTMFDHICEKYDQKCFYATNGEDGVNNEYRLRLYTSFVKLDFFVPGNKKIIEFDGDYWHSDKNPNNICSEQRDFRIKNKYPTLQILHIWESDYRKDSQGTVNRCLDFLNE